MDAGPRFEVAKGAQTALGVAAASTAEGGDVQVRMTPGVAAAVRALAQWVGGPWPARAETLAVPETANTEFSHAQFCGVCLALLEKLRRPGQPWLRVAAASIAGGERCTRPEVIQDIGKDARQKLAQMRPGLDSMALVVRRGASCDVKIPAVAILAQGPSSSAHCPTCASARAREPLLGGWAGMGDVDVVAAERLAALLAAVAAANAAGASRRLVATAAVALALFRGSRCQPSPPVAGVADASAASIE